MVKNLILFSFLFVTCQAIGQKNYIVFRQNERDIELKWYTSDLIIKNPTNLYRREENGVWEKLNNPHNSVGKYTFGSAEIADDKELPKYKDLAKTQKKLEGIGLLVATLKTFKSIPFSKFLGIYYKDDLSGILGKIQYKVTEQTNDGEKEIAISDWISIGGQVTPIVVDSIQFTLKKKGVHFVWKPELTKYYGVSIFRSLSPDSLGNLITKDPVIISKIKNPKGIEEFPKYFFTDEKLIEKQTYYYTFAGIDFFGGETTHSEKIKVRIKDDTKPIAPTNLQKSIFDKTVRIRWNKESEESDFGSYNLYLYSDKDTILKKQNKTNLSFSDSLFEFTVLEYDLYYVKVSAMDDDGNEGFSSELILDVLDKIPPAPPVGIEIIRDTGRLIMKWQKNTETDILGYKIYRTVKGNQLNLSLLSADVCLFNEYIDTLPKNAINSFGYALIAIDTNLNESNLSKTVSAKMIDATPPREPFLKSVSQVEDKVVLKWVKNTELDLKGYQIYRKNESNSVSNFVEINAAILPGEIGEYLDRSVQLGNQYVYKIIAIDSNSNLSTPSNLVQIKTRKQEKESQNQITFTKLKYDKRKKSVRLNWKTSFENKDNYFIVLRREGNKEFQIISPKSKDYQCVDKTATPNAVYEYQIRMYDSQGRITRSDIKSIQIPTKKTKNDENE